MSGNLRPGKRGRCAVWLAFALLMITAVVACGSDRPSWVERFHYESNEVCDITIGRYGYPYLAGMIDGQRILFAIDTANMSGLLVSTDVATRLNLKVTGETLIYDSTGEKIGTSRRYHVDRLSLCGGEGWRDQTATEDERNDVDAFFGPHYLLGSRFTLDYRMKRLAVSGAPFNWPSDAGVALPLVWSERYPGMLVVRGYVNDHPVLIQVDTGKSRTCVDPAFADSLGLEKTPDGFRIAQIRVGDRTFTVPSAKAVGFQGISEGLPARIAAGIGSDILSQIVMSVDYPKRVMFVSHH